MDELTFFDFAAPRPWTLEDKSGAPHPFVAIHSPGRNSTVAFKYMPKPHEVHDFRLIVEAVNAFERPSA